jgi:hypothetical protein
LLVLKKIQKISKIEIYKKKKKRKEKEKLRD